MHPTDQIPKPPSTPPPPVAGTSVTFEPKEWPRKPAGVGILCLVLFTALAMNLATHSNFASVIGAVAAVGCACVVLVTATKKTPELYGALALVALLSTNLLLRTSAWVIGPTCAAIATFVLLGASAQVLAARPFILLRVAFRWFENLIVHTFGWISAPALEARRQGSVQIVSIIRGTVVATAIATLLVLLLAAADSVFASLLGGLAGSSIWTHLFLVGLFTFVVGAVGATASSTEPLPEAQPQMGRFGVEGFMALASINVVLGIWCAIQVFVATGQADEILLTEGLSRAEYARRGFFELVVVAAVVVGLLTLIDRFTDRKSRRVNLIFVGMGIFAVVETIALVVTTYGRLDLYMDEFGLTMLRLSVACFLAWLAAVLLLVAVRLSGLTGANNWTTLAPLVLAALATVGFGWANPESIVAKYNTDRGHSATVLVDGRYLATLSPDAAPALVDALDDLDVGVAEVLQSELCQPNDVSRNYWVLSWNWSQAKAEAALGELSC